MIKNDPLNYHKSGTYDLKMIVLIDKNWLYCSVIE